MNATKFEVKQKSNVKPTNYLQGNMKPINSEANKLSLFDRPNVKLEPGFDHKNASASQSKVSQGKMTQSDGDMTFHWDLSTSIAEDVDCDVEVVRVIVSLLDDDNTIPFIARYRKEQTNGMGPEKLREVKEKLDEFREVQEKATKALVKVEAQGQLDTVLKSAFLSAKSLEEVDHLYTPFKQASKRSLAQRAQELGLQAYAESFIKSAKPLNLSDALDCSREGLTNLTDIEKGVQHIIASIIAKDEKTLSKVREVYNSPYVTLNSKLLQSASKPEAKGKGKSLKENSKKEKKSSKSCDVEKFQEYFSFSMSIKRVKPHQVLAINRGESLKILNVTIAIPEQVRETFLRNCRVTFIPSGATSYSSKLILDSAVDAYKRLIQPLLCRHIRSKLNEAAEKASVSVFASNLKNLLLTPPVRAGSVLGVDPGFVNGCKYAIVSASGKVEATGVAYLHKTNANQQAELTKIKTALLQHSCETVAIGNGVGCRETETLFSNCIQHNMFHPLNVSFCIVSEDGASIYSASELASSELPDLDISVRGAVSIARRLQDPLAELVKIEPKNIGVGMYQHDILEKKLKISLDGVVEDCVSFVGADVNVASEVLLSHVAGIGPALAKKLVKHRESSGPFINRSHLMCVPGLGPKTYKQCAGFLRVLPDTACDSKYNKEPTNYETSTDVKIGSKRKLAASSTGSKKQKLDAIDQQPNPFDMTGIHPESYSIAARLLQKASLQKDSVGHSSFIHQLKTFLKSHRVESLVKEFCCELATLEQIIEELLKPVGHDIRDGNQKPMFKQNVMKMEDLKLGVVVSGRVTNVTHFGSFVDIGVGKDGLLHNSGLTSAAMKGRSSLNCGDLIEATVDKLDTSRQRIGLRLTRLL